MLFGNDNAKNIIMEQVSLFEKTYHKKVVFGAMVGSASKSVERYDSDYDTRFLYFDLDDNDEIIRWDKKEEISEKDIHICTYPDNPSKELFWDKVAFWEITSFYNYLRQPVLDGKFSEGLYHLVWWTTCSPWTWDPYGIATKITPFIDRMFKPEYEFSYYLKYINRCMAREKTLIREYLYSAYYAVAIRYSLENHRFAPVSFDSLYYMIEDDEIKRSIDLVSEKYYKSVIEAIEKGTPFSRKMGNKYEIDRIDNLDRFINTVSDMANRVVNNEKNIRGELVDTVNSIIEIIIKALNRKPVKDVVDKDKI